MSIDNGPRLYGNWRAERGWGIGSLSTTSTIVLFGAVLAPLLAVSAVPCATIPLLATSALVIAGVVVRIGGISATDVVLRRARFHRAEAAGWTELSAGVLTERPRAADQPGVLASRRCVPSTSTTAAAGGTPPCGTAAPARSPRSCAAHPSASTSPIPSAPTPGWPPGGPAGRPRLPAADPPPRRHRGHRVAFRLRHPMLAQN